MFSYWSIIFLCFHAISGYADVCFSYLKKNWEEQMYLDVFVEECTSPMCQVTHSTKFCTVVPKICGSSIGSVLHVTLLALRFWCGLYIFGKLSAPIIIYIQKWYIEIWIKFYRPVLWGCVCACMRARIELSVLCSLCLLQPFFRWTLFLYLAYMAVGWPNLSQLYSSFFCCILYLFNMSKFSESDEVLPLGIVCKQWLKMLIV